VDWLAITANQGTAFSEEYQPKLLLLLYYLEIGDKTQRDATTRSQADQENTIYELFLIKYLFYIQYF